MSSLSLRTRVLAGLSAVAVVLIVAVFAVVTTTRSHLVRQVDTQLIAASSFERDSRFEPGDRFEDAAGDFEHLPPLPAGSTGFGEPPERLSALFEGFVAPNGTLVIFFEPNLPGQDFSPPDIDTANIDPAHGVFTSDSTDGDVRYRVIATSTVAGTFIRALPLADVDNTVNRLIMFQVLGLAAVLAVLGAVAWWVIHLGIRPIQEMTDTATKIAGGDLSVRVPEPSASGTESAELARALNAMLGRIEDAVDEQNSADRRLRQFVADASHELRTPITTIRGYSELYRLGGLTDKDALDDAMRRTEAEAQRMARLVEDMLTLAKLDQERPIEQIDVDLTLLLQNTVADARVVAPEREISIDVENNLTVIGDNDRLQQVMANMVGNAVVHTHNETTVRVSANRAGSEIIVEVGDNGPGMPPEVAERVTERFYRADPSRSRDKGGSGLGMAIVESVVGAHGGELSIVSDPGNGTIVRMVLPASS